MLIQCCLMTQASITTPQREHVAKYVLASSGQVGKIVARAGVKQLVLTHFDVSNGDGALLKSIEHDIKRDFGGELILGEDLLEIEI